MSTGGSSQPDVSPCRLCATFFAFPRDDKRCHSSESYNFEAVHNIDEYRVETVSTFREALRTWNMTVQYWLVVNVYKTFPVKGQLARSLAVMTASSGWIH